MQVRLALQERKNITMDFGANLKKLRKEKTLTQEELAECLNVSPQTVSKWENNLSMPDISVLPLLADYFGISLDALLLYNVDHRDKERKDFAKRIHDIAEGGNRAEAYKTLKESMGKWALSASMNHLMSWAAYQFSKEIEGEERQQLLEEALMYADRVIRLDGGETSRTAQAKMTKCYCMVDMGRKSEAVKVANSLPSLYSTRERVLTLISDGKDRKVYAETALQYLEEIKAEITQFRYQLSGDTEVLG